MVAHPEEQTYPRALLCLHQGTPEVSVTSPANKNAYSKGTNTLLRGLEYRSKESEAKNFQREEGAPRAVHQASHSQALTERIQGGSNSWQNSAIWASDVAHTGKDEQGLRQLLSPL